MGKASTALLFFIGWLLSPFTWWNDAFVNIPLSYLLANAIYAVFRFPFKWLVISSYWLTNILGLWFMYSGGRGVVISSKDRIKSVSILLIFIIIYSSAMLYLENRGKLIPFSLYFEKFCVKR
ncbi:MAG: hypothetical protein JW800_00210 [Candidatus Omnitrophica bacterium]|nr:hypothetical protein [Candidatus Omnitrophota bacterium]